MLIPARTGSLKKCIPLLSKRLEAWKTLSDMDEETNQDDMRIMSSKFRRESIIPEQFVMCHYRRTFDGCCGIYFVPQFTKSTSNWYKLHTLQ